MNCNRNQETKNPDAGKGDIYDTKKGPSYLTMDGARVYMGDLVWLMEDQPRLAAEYRGVKFQPKPGILACARTKAVHDRRMAEGIQWADWFFVPLQRDGITPSWSCCVHLNRVSYGGYMHYLDGAFSSVKKAAEHWNKMADNAMDDIEAKKQRVSATKVDPENLVLKVEPRISHRDP